MAYCTATQVKTYKGISSTDDDSLLGDLIIRAQAMIDAYCHRTFEASTDTTRYLNAVRDVDGRTLWLRDDCVSITSITNGDGIAVASSEYVTMPRHDTPYYAVRLLASSLTRWTYSGDPENAIAVTGKWAYSVSAPSDVVQACIHLTLWLYDLRDTTPDVLRGRISPDGTVLLPMAWPDIVRALLAPYRRMT